MGIPDYFTCLLRNLNVGQEAIVRTGRFEIGKGLRPGYMLSLCLTYMQSTKLKKEPGARNRDICGLMNKGSYMSERKCPGTTPHSGRQTAGRTRQQASLPGREGDFQLQNF